MSKRAESQYCTVREAARMLDVSPVTVWRWIEARELPAVRVGPRNIRLKKDDVESMIKPARATDAATGIERVETAPTRRRELARRKVLVAQILERRRERVIAPLTSVELVRKVREGEQRRHAG